MKFRTAFTMIELIFVIVIMGIIGKFGTEFLVQAYNSFISTKINNSLQSQSASAVELIAARLQYRIKDSVIARISDTSTPIGIGSASGTDYKVLEWVAYDIDGFRGDSTPNWSGILDLDAGDANSLISPATDTSKIDALIQTLSYGNGNSNISDAALYFIGSDSDVVSGYGWDTDVTLINLQQGTMHPITSTSNLEEFVSSTGTNFSGITLSEYYKLAWTANAIVYTPGTNDKGTLTLWYDYQPWKGDRFSAGKSAILMQNVSTFSFMSIGSLLKIQVCVKSDILEEYSLCKEKTIF